MMGRRWKSVAIAGTLGLAGVGGGLAYWNQPAREGGRATQGDAASATSPMRVLAEGLRRGDPQALAGLCQQVLAGAEKPRPAVGEAEGEDLLAVLEGLRAGFLKFAPVGRASAVSAATHILDRYAIEPAPSSWIRALPTIHDLVIAGLADTSVEVRGSTLTEVGRHWNWLPGRTMTPAEEIQLATWKDGFYAPARRCLGDREPKSRAAAVVCIGTLPLDSMAAPAAAYVDDPESGGVRYKALMTFANRPNLLPVDSILRRLHDPETGIPELAELILKGRGLTKDQVLLGRQIFNPHPEIRASVIPLLRERTDIDPVVWLLQLSHDADEAVRAKAVEALVDRVSPEVDRRLREMAATDASPSIRATAGKHVARTSGETTASLPPLPGSPGLTPKAN
jgi:hypothetical protein